MSTKISNWKGLSKLRPNNKYRIVMDINEDGDILGAWIRPTKEYYKKVKDDIWSKHNLYLGSNIFNGKNQEWATKMLQKFGFDVVIEK